ncbi:MAG: IS3 family transposase [Coriobacteriia bacterium]|nr:IS3 family transposase [Coriobacteriia bacterium]
MGTFAGSRSVYGARRIRAALQKKGISISGRRCPRPMRSLGIRGVSERKGRPKAAKAGVGTALAADLVRRDSSADRPGRVWSADTTYARVTAGRPCLAAVFGIFLRIVVGWSMGQTMTARLVDDALRMGVAGRRPEAGLVHRSGHGGQYLSVMLGQTLRQFGITPSMGAVRSPWDNAACEPLVSTVKAGCTDVATYKSYEHAKPGIFGYIEVFYNKTRIHSSIGMMSPTGFEERYYAGLAKVS